MYRNSGWATSFVKMMQEIQRRLFYDRIACISIPSKNVPGFQPLFVEKNELQVKNTS